MLGIWTQLLCLWKGFTEWAISLVQQLDLKTALYPESWQSEKRVTSYTGRLARIASSTSKWYGENGGYKGSQQFRTSVYPCGQVVIHALGPRISVFFSSPIAFFPYPVGVWALAHIETLNQVSSHWYLPCTLPGTLAACPCWAELASDSVCCW